VRKSTAIGFLTVLAFGALITFIRLSEPRYTGRTLTSWLQQYSDAAMDETQRLAEARSAVLVIGAQKALPRIVELAATEDDPVSTWMIAKTEEFRIRFHWRSAEECQLLGFDGFEILGTNAAPAVPKLTRLLADNKQAFTAVRCLATIGKPAETALCQCLTNQNPDVRRVGVSGLASATDDVEVYLARIRGLLKDSDSSVRFEVVQAIGSQENAPDLAVPLLIIASQDSDGAVASQAVDALGGFGTNAASAFSALTNLVNTGRSASTRAATKALVAIAPIKAVPVLSNAVVNGSPETLITTLRDLKSVAPTLALKMALDAFQSPDARRRLRAVSVALDYKIATPGIGDALKQAKADSDPEVAERALMTMKQMMQTERASPDDDVQFPNEPSYQGKSLGEWLKLRRGWELSTNAVEAVRNLGTNAISALLARLSYKDPVFDLYSYDVSMVGVTGMIALREQAKPALPALTALMNSNDQELAMCAMLATFGTGADAIPSVISGLTNRFPDVRDEAASELAELGSQFPEQSKTAIPLLLKLLNDPDGYVRIAATNGLKQIDPKAAAQAGIK
jgi:HEAT repeat protein